MGVALLILAALPIPPLLLLLVLSQPALKAPSKLLPVLRTVALVVFIRTMVMTITIALDNDDKVKI